MAVLNIGSLIAKVYVTHVRFFNSSSQLQLYVIYINIIDPSAVFLLTGL